MRECADDTIIMPLQGNVIEFTEKAKIYKYRYLPLIIVHYSFVIAYTT
jgi:hypothetical protein